MATMTHRTTFALDKGAMTRIKKLSTLWSASQAEVIRRSLEIAENAQEQEKAATLRLEKAKLLHQRLGKRRLDVEGWIASARDSRR